MQFKKMAFLTILSLLFFTGCSDSKVEEKSVDAPIEKKTEFALSNIDGNTIEVKADDKKLFFAQYEGKVILLNFFATWCPPCRAEIPTLNNLRQEFTENFEVVSLSLAKRDGKLNTNEELEEFINKYNISYPIVNSAENYALAKEMGGVESIPTMFLIDTKGNVIQKYVGIVPQEMLETDINKVLGK